jgi:hypothetical protein
VFDRLGLVLEASAGVRSPAALKELQADEQLQWNRLWADVRALRDRAKPAASK